MGPKMNDRLAAGALCTAIIDFMVVASQRRSHSSRRLASGALALGLGLAATSASALTVVPTFDSTISPTMQAAITSAASLYPTLYGDPITVNVYFQGMSNAGAAGASLSSYYDSFSLTPSSSYKSWLQADAAAHPENTTLATASTNSVYLNSYSTHMQLNTANLRALGQNQGFASLTTYTFSGYLLPAQPGTLITSLLNNPLSTRLFDSTRGGTTYHLTNCIIGADTCAGAGYDGLAFADVGLDYTTYGGTGMWAIWHELNEVLGVGGGGSTCSSVGCPGNGSLDPYRYRAPGVVCDTVLYGCYFSIDGGVTKIADFHSGSGGSFTNVGDLGDFTGIPCDPNNWIQGCAGTTIYDPSSPSYLAMLSVGYDPLTAVPEPSTLVLLASGIGVMGSNGRRRRREARAAD